MNRAWGRGHPLGQVLALLPLGTTQSCLELRRQTGCGRVKDTEVVSGQSAGHPPSPDLRPIVWAEPARKSPTVL